MSRGIFLKSFLLALLVPMFSERVSWALTTFMPKAAALENVCNSTIACSVIDKTWPRNKTFTCGSEHVTSTAFDTVTQALSVGQPKSNVNDTNWPSSSSTNCSGLDPNHSKNAYNNGLFTVYYTIQSICNCPRDRASSPVIPMCQSATSQDLSACNLAVFKFCSVKMNNLTCNFQ